MNGRTCQLCGKPLSRIWVGAGGDFCSREHRNQYRLRRGMDRLTEANAVATLMRRREHLKPLAPTRLTSAEDIARRAYPPTKIVAMEEVALEFAPSLPALPALGLCSTTRTFMRARPVCLPE